MKIRYEVKLKPSANLVLPEGVSAKDVNKALAKYFYRRIRFFTPVDTGKLKRNWKIDLFARGFKLTNNVKYGSYLDTGETMAKDKTKGFMLFNALRDATKRVNNLYKIDINSLYEIKKIYR